MPKCSNCGKEYTENYLLPQLFSFADDDNYQIRENILENLPELCQIVSLNTIKTKVFELLKRLSNDKISSVIVDSPYYNFINLFFNSLATFV